MEQKIGFMGVLFIFGIFVMPLLIHTFEGHVKGGKALNVSTELQQAISAEGGVTPKIESALNKLRAKGYEINISTSNGASTGVFPVGTEVEIYVDIDGFNTKSYATVNRRTSMLIVTERAAFI